MIQTADAAMDQVGQSLTRMKELTVQAANDTYSKEDRAVIQMEIDQLKEHIDQTANDTEFNGIKMLKNENVWTNEFPHHEKMQAGANIDEQIDIPMFNVSTEVLEVNNIDVSSTDSCNEALEAIESASAQVNRARSKYGAIQQRLETSSTNLAQSTSTIENASSRISDADIALEMLEFSKTSILRDTSTAILQQTNNFPKDVLRILENIK